MNKTWAVALSIFCLLGAAPAWGQGQDPPVHTTGLVSLTSTNAGTCTLAAPTVGCAVLNLLGVSGVSVQVTGTFSGTLQFETTTDRSTWVAVSMFPPNSATGVSSVTAPGLWMGTGSVLFRVRASTFASGTAVVTITAKLLPVASNIGTRTITGCTVPGATTDVMYNLSGACAAGAEFTFDPSTSNIGVALTGGTPFLLYPADADGAFEMDVSGGGYLLMDATSGDLEISKHYGGFAGGTTTVEHLVVVQEITLGNSLYLGGESTVTLSGAIPTRGYGFQENMNWAGTTSSTDVAFNKLLSNGDSAVIATSANWYADYFRVTGGGIGAGAVGGRNAIHGVLTVSAVTGNKVAGNSDSSYIAGLFENSASSGDGGTGTGITTAYGNLYGTNRNVALNNGATNWYGITGDEINVGIATGASARTKTGLQIVKTTLDRVQGIIDHAFVIADQVDASIPAWKTGVKFGTEAAQWPFSSSSTIIKGVLGQNYGTITSAANYGLDFLTTTFSSAFLRSQAFSVDGSGVLQVGAVYTSPTAAGFTIDPRGSVGALSAVASGGSGWAVNDIAYDAYGGVYLVTGVTAGAVTSVSLYRAPIIPGSAPSNPVALTADVRGGGTGLTENLTWTARTGITILGTATGAWKSSDGTAGATTTCTLLSITAITVKNGLITGCS